MIEFSEGNNLRLALYRQSKTAVALKRKGSSFSKDYLDPEVVVKTAKYYAEHPEEWESHSMNISQKFATYCKTTWHISLEFKSCDDDLKAFISKMLMPQVYPTEETHAKVGIFTHDISFEDLKPGDHISAYRRAGFTTQHHGINLGSKDGGEPIIVHFNSYSTTASGTMVKVAEQPLSEFLNGNKLRMVDYDSEVTKAHAKRAGNEQVLRSLPTNLVISIVTYFVTHPDEWHEYNIVINNCESFALFCKTGVVCPVDFLT